MNCIDDINIPLDYLDLLFKIVYEVVPRYDVSCGAEAERLLSIDGAIENAQAMIEHRGRTDKIIKIYSSHLHSTRAEIIEYQESTFYEWIEFLNKSLKEKYTTRRRSGHTRRYRERQSFTYDLQCWWRNTCAIDNDDLLELFISEEIKLKWPEDPIKDKRTVKKLIDQSRTRENLAPPKHDPTS